MRFRRSKTSPPLIGEWLLESFCSFDFLATARWDLEEFYQENLLEKGRWRADLRFMRDVLSVIFHIGLKGKSHYTPNRVAMFKNNFIISLRNFKKNKAYGLINTAGLTIGLSAFILISMFIDHELSYDKFHPDHDSIFRVSHVRNVPMGSFEFAKSIPLSLAPLVADHVPEIQGYTRYSRTGETIVSYGDKLFYETGGIYAEDSFFEFFNFSVVAGSLDGVLNDAETILITESMASKYFEDSDPIGKMITLNKRMPHKVVAVVQDPPTNTMIQFKYILSLPGLERRLQGTWLNYPSFTFFKINPEQKEVVFAKMDSVKNQFFPENFSDKKAIDRDLQPSYFNIQPLVDLHLDSRIESEISVTGDKRYIYVFSTVGLVILIIACVNYTNAATAKSITRSKEVGVRKSVGASKRSLINLYLSETFLYVLVSVFLSFFLIAWVLPQFNQLVEKDLSILDMSGEFIALILGLIFAVSFLSGIYPALFLSKISAVAALKGKLPQSKGSRLKKGLIVFQFLAAQVLVIVTIIIQSQLSYLQNKDIGYDKERLIYIPTRGELKESYAAFKNEINALPSVTSSAYAMNLLGDGSQTAFPMNHFEGHEADNDENLWMNYYGVTENFIQTMGMDLVDGGDFENDGDRGMIINETLAKMLGWENPIGKVVKPQPYGTAHQPPIPIVGVLKDFNDQSLKSEIKPMMMSISPDSVNNRYMLVRLNAQDVPGTIAEIGDIWEKQVGDRPFDFTFYEDKFTRQYNAEFRQGKMFWVFAGLAIGISILGIIGLSSFMVEQRMKEFSIRKILGASLRQLMMMVNRGFLLPIVIAFVIAAPLAYYWTHDQWLTEFVYRIEIQPWVFVLAIAVTLLLTVLTASYHSLKLKRVNPTEYLGTE